MSGETVRATLNELWQVLEPLGIPCALIGGLAMAIWNHPRATRDVDLLIGVDLDHIDPVVEKLEQAGCRPKSSSLITSVGAHHFAQFLYTPPDELYDIPLDLLLAESDFQNAALSRRVSRSVAGVDSEIDVLHCNDLILFKLLAGRMIDRADAAMLLRENRGELDLDHLHAWVIELKLHEDFTQIWEEAFPGESFPAT